LGVLSVNVKPREVIGGGGEGELNAHFLQAVHTETADTALLLEDTEDQFTTDLLPLLN
jgi:hypothetical protein